MDFADITKKAENLLKDEKVKKAISSEQAEEISDKLLNSAAEAAKKAAGGKFHDQIDGARDAADKKVGNS